VIERLSVRNFILVDQLDLEFTGGFNVLTGETGAGKSILVGALSVLFGGKGGPDLVRSGADEASVAGEFFVGDHPAGRAWLEDHGISPEEGRVLLRRTLKTTGRGTIYIGSTPATLAELEEFAGLLLDLHSQHEHQSLFSEANHRQIVDRYADIEEDVLEFHGRFNHLADLQNRLKDIEALERERNREMEMLEFACNEIDEAALQPGELEELEQERERLVHHEKLAEHVQTIAEIFDGTEYSVLAMLKRLRHEYAAAVRIDGSLQGDQQRVDSAFFELEDISQNLTDFQESLVFDPTRLEEIEDRLALLRRLVRKYGETEEEILNYAEESRSTLETLQRTQASREELLKEISETEQWITRSAKELHSRRSAAAAELKDQIQKVLRDLAMGQARFEVEVETRTNDRGRLVCGPYGADRIRFLISTNVGVSPQPLVKVASGGELSRVMLAIKTVVAEVDDVRSLIFDEIDTGIGGQVALAISSHMRKLADHGQVISITHLATIAVRADNHIVVEKNAVGEHTVISVRNVLAEQRVREIARMLAGEQDEVSGVEHARALLERYQRGNHGQNQ
jgi:DNA repair protein RecN (Recombination protein N)